MQSYSEYLNVWNGRSLSIDKSLEIYDEMIYGINSSKTEDIMDFVKDMVDKANKYTSIRCKWEFMTNEERMEEDSMRTALHNSFITSINIVSRILVSEGIDVSWREKLGDDRKIVGDFACFISFMIGITNR